MLSSTLNRASRSVRARRVVERVPLTRGVVDRFVAGDGLPEALATTSLLLEGGRRVSLDVLGEDCTNELQARTTTSEYLTLLHGLSELERSPGTDVSVKLSALGQGITGTGETLAYDLAYEICEAAEAADCTVTLDMEDHTTVESSLVIGERLRSRFPWVGNVLQSNLRRTTADLRDLQDSRARIRIVKGAYREPPSVAFQRKTDVDEAYRSHVTMLMKSSCYPMVATHDPVMLAHATTEARRFADGPGSWEVQMLLGVRLDLQEAAVADGQVLRVYVPFGSDWYGYFMRRLAERPANVAFFLRALMNR